MLCLHQRKTTNMKFEKSHEESQMDTHLMSHHLEATNTYNRFMIRKKTWVYFFKEKIKSTEFVQRIQGNNRNKSS